MERKDKMILLVLALGAGYAGFVHWDWISAKLSLDDLSPGRIKAIDLAKKDLTFDGLQANSLVMRERARNGEIKMEEEPWEATRIDENRFVVVVAFIEDGLPKSHRFDVNIATGGVKLIPPTSAQPPR